MQVPTSMTEGELTALAGWRRTSIQQRGGCLVKATCGNIRYFWLVSEESSWLCAYLDERDEVVQCASSALVGRAYSALENSMLREQFGIRDSGHRKNARVRLHQLARPIEVVSS